MKVEPEDSFTGGYGLDHSLIVVSAMPSQETVTHVFLSFSNKQEQNYLGFRGTVKLTFFSPLERARRVLCTCFLSAKCGTIPLTRFQVTSYLIGALDQWWDDRYDFHDSPAKVTVQVQFVVACVGIECQKLSLTGASWRMTTVVFGGSWFHLLLLLLLLLL